MKILFATPVLRHPPIGGPTLRVENSIKALSQVADLSIYSRVPLHHLGGEHGKEFYQQFCKGFYMAPSAVLSIGRYIRFAKRVINFGILKLFGRNLFGAGRAHQEDFKPILDVADSIQADVIWLGYGNVSYPLLKYIKSHSNYKVVLDTDSVWSRFILRGLPYAMDAEERGKIEGEGRTKEDEEGWGTQLADVTTAVSEVDAVYYRSLAKVPQQVHIFSNVIDIDLYQRVPPPPENFKKPCVFLAGTFFSPTCPMVDAALWVIREILPLVRQQLPDLHFYVVGIGSDRVLSDIRDPGITVTGQVESVLPFLCHADVALVPLRFESGTRFKILEAGACGVPVVSTTLGAEGIPVISGRDILIADQAQAFADSVVNLIQNPDLGQRLGSNLKKLVEERYGVTSLAEEGRLILDYLCSSSPSERISVGTG